MSTAIASHAHVHALTRHESHVGHRVHLLHHSPVRFVVQQTATTTPLAESHVVEALVHVVAQDTRESQAHIGDCLVAFKQLATILSTKSVHNSVSNRVGALDGRRLERIRLGLVESKRQ